MPATIHSKITTEDENPALTEYQYQLKRMGASSDKYGPCEVCKKHVSDVFHQTESRYTERGRWTYSGCHNFFGHEDCLISKRR